MAFAVPFITAYFLEGSHCIVTVFRLYTEMELLCLHPWQHAEQPFSCPHAHFTLLFQADLRVISLSSPRHFDIWADYE